MLWIKVTIFWLFWTYFMTLAHKRWQWKRQLKRAESELLALYSAPLPSYGNPTQAGPKQNAPVRSSRANDRFQCEGHTDIADAYACASCQSGKCQCEGCKRIRRHQDPPLNEQLKKTMSKEMILDQPAISAPQRYGEDRGTRIARELVARQQQARRQGFGLVA